MTKSEHTSPLPIITIDGPSASGKGTIAQRVANQLGFHYLDSGALYRIVAYAAKTHHLSWQDEAAVAQLAQQLNIAFVGDSILFNTQNISLAIRTEEISSGASQVAALPQVRTALFHLQRSFLKPNGLVADGRDMGTVIFPEAATKIFLTASAQVRAQRRYQQLTAKQLAADYDSILKDLQQRDARDQNRSSAPLVAATDAHHIHTDNLGIDATVALVLQHFHAKNAKNP